MQNAWLDEAQPGIKIAGRNINNLRCAGGTTLMAKSKGPLKFSHSVVPYSLWHHRLPYTRLPYPLLSPRACSNIQPSHPLSSLSPPTFSLPHIRVFSNELVLPIRWPKYWSFSFSISPSNEYSRLISFRIDWLDLLAVKGLSKVFSDTIVQKHQFFGTQLSSQSNSHIHTWPLEKP